MVFLYSQLLRRRHQGLCREAKRAQRRQRSLKQFRRQLFQNFSQRFSPTYRQPRKVSGVRLRKPRFGPGFTRKESRKAPRRKNFKRRSLQPRHMRLFQRAQRRQRRHQRSGTLAQRRQRLVSPLFGPSKEQKISTQSWKTLQRPLPRTLSFRYTQPGQRHSSGRWRFPPLPALVRSKGRLRRLFYKKISPTFLPQRGERLRERLLHPGRDRQRHSSRLPLVHYRVLELTIGDLTALDEEGNELPPERWLVLERTYGPVGYDSLMADLFGVLTPALRLMAKVVGHKSARRTVYHARDGVPLDQRRKLVFGWLRDLVNKNPDYNYLRRNTLRKRPSKRVLLRPERSRRLTEPFQSRLYAELHQLLQPDEPIMERLEDFDEKSHLLRLTRRHYR